MKASCQGHNKNLCATVFTVYACTDMMHQPHPIHLASQCGWPNGPGSVPVTSRVCLGTNELAGAIMSNQAYGRHSICTSVARSWPAMPCLCCAMAWHHAGAGQWADQGNPLQDLFWCKAGTHLMVHEGSSLLGLAALCRCQRIQSCRACHQAHSDCLQHRTPYWP